MRRVGAVAIVLLGFWIIAGAISLVASSSWLATNITELDAASALAIAAFVGGLVALGSFGAWLVRNRNKLAARLFDEDPTGALLRPLELLRVGLILFGLWMLLASLLRIANAVNLWVVVGGMGRDSGLWDARRMSWDAATQSVVAVVELALGVLFARKSSAIAAWLWVEKEIDPPADNLPKCPRCGESYNPEDYRDMSSALCSHCKTPLDGSA